MNRLEISNYNLEKTLLGGQSFSWDLINGVYWGVHKDTVIKLIDNNDHWLWQTYPQRNQEDLIKEYFRLDVDFNKIENEIQKDEYIKKALDTYPGLRLLNMDLEQTIISFLLSSNRNIPSIRKNIRNLSQLLGNKIIVEENIFYTFPTLKSIAGCSLEDLRSTGIGYRAEYIKKSSQLLITTDLLSKIQIASQSQDVDAVRSYLIELHGVGNKVADCIMCYSLKLDSVTPLDVWAQRFCNLYYGLDTKKYLDTSKWLTDYFGDYTAWAGQYLFEYIREKEDFGD
jgi:N-glycosylase/DNA lyase